MIQLKVTMRQIASCRSSTHKPHVSLRGTWTSLLKVSFTVLEAPTKWRVCSGHLTVAFSRVLHCPQDRGVHNVHNVVRSRVVSLPVLGTIFQFVRRTPSKSRDCARAYRPVVTVVNGTCNSWKRTPQLGNAFSNSMSRDQGKREGNAFQKRITVTVRRRLGGWDQRGPYTCADTKQKAAVGLRQSLLPYNGQGNSKLSSPLHMTSGGGSALQKTNHFERSCSRAPKPHLIEVSA